MVGTGLFQMLFLFLLAENLLDCGVHNNFELKYRHVVIGYHIEGIII